MEWRNSYYPQDILRSFERRFDPDSFLIYNFGSFGDIFLTFAFLRSLTQYNPQKKIIVFTEARWAKLAGRFQLENVSFKFIDDAAANLLRRGFYGLYTLGQLTPGRIFPALPTVHPNVAELTITRRVSDLEARRFLFGLPIGAPLFLSPLTSPLRDDFDRFIAQYGMPRGRSIIISPIGNTLRSVPPEVVARLARVCLSYNLHVFLNISGTKAQTDLYVGLTSEFQSIHLPAEFAIEVIDHCGFHIGGSNGLAFLAAIFCNNECSLGQLVPPNNGFITHNGLRAAVETILIDHALGVDKNLGTAAFTYDSTTLEADISNLVKGIFLTHEKN